MCRAACSDCCTCNVTITTLEAHVMLNAFPADQWPRVAKVIDAQMGKPRFTPEATFNQISDLCASGREPPPEAMDASWGPCPLLTDRLCPVYAARPFGCRCMVSSTPCYQTGAAEMGELTATVNTLFLQVIEHIDQDGFSGNLSDVLSFVLAAESNVSVPSRCNHPHLISNRPLRTLMIPPEHQDRVRPILAQIRALPI
ncbi:MAG: hypothetical protein MUE70_06230 [Desulfobacterales bacterium]|nr:hypothetical protein [Desulfobacterales bacterium]